MDLLKENVVGGDTHLSTPESLPQTPASARANSEAQRQQTPPVCDEARLRAGNCRTQPPQPHGTGLPCGPNATAALTPTG